MKSRIVVLGGGGFIGSHLCKQLIAREDYELLVVDKSTEKLKKLSDRPIEQNSDVKIKEIDVRTLSKSESKELVEGCDLVLDLIAYANPSQYIEMPLDVVDVNFFENLPYVEICAEENIRLIQFSTCEVYGMNEEENQIMREDETNLLLGPIQKHRWIYSCAKQLLERMIHAYGMEKGLNYTIIRPFNFIGPYMDYLIEEDEKGGPRVFPQFMSSLLYGHPMYLVDGGKNKRSFTYIQDAVDAIELIIKNPNNSYDQEIVNIGSPENETSIRDLALTMAEIYEEMMSEEPDCNIVEISSEEFYGEGYDDTHRRIPDITKLQSEGWAPQYSLRETLSTSIEFYLSATGNLNESQVGESVV